MSRPLLEMRRVSLRRPGVDGQLQTVVKDASLAASAGELVAVVGPSGGGKSTLLRLFNRLLEPDSGSVHLDGQDIRTLFPPTLRARVTLVPQKPLMFQGTVSDNLAMPARLRRESTQQKRDDDDRRLLELCRIDADLLNRDSQRLSVGQQQRVSLARAMTGPCQALLLDEPTSALDWPTADSLSDTFRDLVEERRLAVILVTHDLRVARRCADRLVVLIDGEIHDDGPINEVLAAPGSEQSEAFLKHPEAAPAEVTP